jgi:hypothetical protein
MQVQRDGQAVKLHLSSRETYLLRRALERASLMDTPVTEQAEILTFCARALEALPTPTP